MKSSVTAAALVAALFATPLAAGSVADPVIEAPVIVADAESSSSGAALVLALAVLMAIPVASD